MRFSFETLPENYINWLSLVSKRARANIIKMTSVANSGHPGGSMSSIDIYISTILFSNIFENYEKIHNGEFDFSGYDLNLLEKKKRSLFYQKFIRVKISILLLYLMGTHPQDGMQLLSLLVF